VVCLWLVVLTEAMSVLKSAAGIRVRGSLHQCLFWDSESLPHVLGQKYLENTEKNMLQMLCRYVAVFQ